MLGAMAGVSLEDMPPPASASPPPQMFDRPVLRPENLVTVACTAFGPGQAQTLAPSILETDTQLTQAKVTERLHLLWMMRCEVASQVREIILLREVRREPPGTVLHELLDLTELYTWDTD